METSDQGAGIARSGRDHKCPQCGANNRADAQWCWQCLERFEAPASEDVTAPEADAEPRFSNRLPAEPNVAPATDDAMPHRNGHDPELLDERRSNVVTVKEPEVEAVIEGERGTIEVKGRQITWTCSRCETVNGFERNICEVCGATFAEVLKEPDEDKPKRDPNTVALVSLFFPGAGHGYLGMWGQAVARGVISLWVIATAVFAAAQGATQSLIVAVVFGLVSFALWAVSAHDAYREAKGQTNAVLLRDKLFLYLVLGLLLLSVMMVFSLAMGARG